jgi:hypothetical protein
MMGASRGSKDQEARHRTEPAPRKAGSGLRDGSCAPRMHDKMKVEWDNITREIKNYEEKRKKARAGERAGREKGKGRERGRKGVASNG